MRSLLYELGLQLPFQVQKPVLSYMEMAAFIENRKLFLHVWSGQLVLLVEVNQDIVELSVLFVDFSSLWLRQDPVASQILLQAIDLVLFFWWKATYLDISSCGIIAVKTVTFGLDILNPCQSADLHKMKLKDLYTKTISILTCLSFHILWWMDLPECASSW